ncbi:acylphosphatase [Bordetella holmesii]|uniref:acylphosphatase n=2 Tax=Bordetella holmesii TaxID=35814 RepID=A0A158M1V4_9BORD|nr:acylphosphatase [Bordetella holmesii]AHV92072.1 acylphosphatase family protein [Bordetella holmesii ATCC 51541]AIT26311.1 acylphosphatase family protein [Bordetella holmesii 44057]EWM41711.1 acylphosphatase family protein [Bordetella holmesii 41130]EWM46884.1 acylphosphatase family protein [Bordetella holmesii 35009]EWM51057.1 acylphosphatase family protein [Bordetella holmesii 70147]
MQDPHIETVFVVVRGKVQGVGYRHATVRRAHLIGATGWVQNMEDGTVEAMVQGTPDQIDQMLEWMRRGPPAAVVTDLESRRDDGERRFKHFAQH